MQKPKGMLFWAYHSRYAAGRREKMDKDRVIPLFDSKFIKVYDLQYEEGRHYYDATRREKDRIAAVQSEEDFRAMLPDGVSCIVVVRTTDGRSCLLLSREYRYPTGHYLLSVPAGLIDPEDAALAGERRNPILEAAKREIHEETNLVVTENDRLEVINPLVFSTPGMTDESNALVLAVVHVDDLSVLDQKGAVGSEKFDGFELLDEAKAGEILRKGTDDEGCYYPVYTFAALVYFVTGLWRER
jgi:ADP-ribose pyrophosphatase